MADLSGDDRVHGRAFRMRLAEIREQIDAAEATIREYGGMLDA